MNDTFGEAVQDGASKGLWRILLAIHAQAVKLAPVDTGKLRQSISIATKDKSQGEVSLEAPSDAMAGVVGTNLEYAAAVEYGRTDMDNYPMQPYLRPAGYAIKMKLKGEMTDELKKALIAMARKRKSSSAIRNRGRA